MVRSVIPRPYLAIVGPTASGKSGLAMRLAKRWNGEIVCCDSVQIYRGFHIGAASPTDAEKQQVPHHLFGVANCNENVDAHVYAQWALRAIEDIHSRNCLPILVGGTGLYLRAVMGPKFHDDLPNDHKLRDRLNQKSQTMLRKLLARLDPKRAEQIHGNDRLRHLRALEIRILSGRCFHELTREVSEVDSRAHVIVIKPNRSALHRSIAKRTRQMLTEGLVAEVEGLLAAGVSMNVKPMQAIGYRQVCEHLQRSSSTDDLLEKIIVATRQYAKRQDTWFAQVQAKARILSPEEFDEDAFMTSVVNAKKDS